MGIEKFYYAIRGKLNEQNSLKQPILLEHKLPTIKYLYIDFNAIIHTISSNVIFNLNTQLATKIIDEISNVTLQQWHQETENTLNDIIINAIITDIINTITIATNTKQIYIAFDGIPEMSKCVEQKRRKLMGYFIRTTEQKITEKINTNDTNENLYNKLKFSFNKNDISAYSTFMINLYNTMKKIITNKNVSISGTDEYGEGEKKIMYTLLNNDDIESNDDILIMSPDADMILLGCVAMYKFSQKNKIPNIFINNIEIINIKDISNLISERVNLNSIKHPMEILKDFIFMFTFFGNDFLPKILTLSDVDKNITLLIDIYKNIIKNSNDTFVIYQNNKHIINFELFYILLEKLLESEQLRYNNYMIKKKIEIVGQFKLSLYDCSKYIAENPYYFCLLNREIPNIYINKANFINKINTDKKLSSLENIKIFIEKYVIINNKDKQNLNKQDLIAFKYKKSIWKFILNDYYDTNIEIPIIGNLVQDYLIGLSFVTTWYFDRMMNSDSLNFLSTWFYPYKNAPHISDIFRYLTKSDKLLLMNAIIIAENDFKIATKDYFQISEYKQYVDVHKIESDNINIFIDKIIDYLIGNKIDYFGGNYEYILKTHKNFLPNLPNLPKLTIDCKHISYLDKCHTYIIPEQYNNFINKIRNRQQGGNTIYLHKYMKYIKKLSALV